MKFEELAQVALLGTERQNCSTSTALTPLGQLESQIDLAQRARALLSLAALCGLHEQVGRLPTTDRSPMPEPCPPETVTVCGDRAAVLLSRLLTGEFEVLLHEWLALAASARVVASPEFLPKLLHLGASKPGLRGPIFNVLGERGAWLAMQNPDWSWVRETTDVDESIWQTGDGSARLAFLRNLRRTDPVRATELLTLGWKEESGEDRPDLIMALESGLSLIDEPFLEAALNDKRKDVRQNAALMLAHLPESALVKRMVERVRPLLKFLPGAPASMLRLKKAKLAIIEVTLPEACDKSMQRDGIDPKPPQSFGEKAWWFIQCLGVVPLPIWVELWGETASEIVAASLQSEWKGELLQGWTFATLHQKNSEWAAELFDFTLQEKGIDACQKLLSIMSLDVREARMTALLHETNPEAAHKQTVFLPHCRHEWSPGFSRVFLDFMRRQSAQDFESWPLRREFAGCAPCLAVETLPEALGGWPTEAGGWAFWSKGVEEFLALVQFRNDLRLVFQPQGQSH